MLRHRSLIAVLLLAGALLVANGCSTASSKPRTQAQDEGGLSEELKLSVDRLMPAGPADNISPALQAVIDGHVEKLKSLIRSPRAANEPIRGGLTLLHVAAALGRVDAIRALLDAGADPNTAEPRDLLTPLHLAIARNFYDASTLLIERGADVRAQTNEGDLSG